MSHQDLARVAVRLLHDPVLAAAVAAGERLPGLSDEELGWLRVVDPRAWEVDALRPARVLKGLVDEFPGSTALALGHTRSAAALRGFFQCPAFHDEVQARGSLAEGYARHLRALAGGRPELEGLLQLELAQARARREIDLRPARLEGPGLVRARGVGAVVVEANALENLNRLEQLLFELSLLPPLALAADGPGLPALLPPSAERLHLVVTPEGLRKLGRVVCEVLLRLDRPLPGLEPLLEELGLPAAVAPRLEADLRAHGLALRE